MVHRCFCFVSPIRILMPPIFFELMMFRHFEMSSNSTAVIMVIYSPGFLVYVYPRPNSSGFVANPKNTSEKNVGLYSDDSLAVINTKSGRLHDKERKELIRIFDDLGLKITKLTNQDRTDFLDLTLDLTNGTYKPYRKPNDEPLYINLSSNHPPTIIRKLPESINRRINKLSSNKNTFYAAAPIYNGARQRSNFNTQLEYEPPNTNTNTQRSRQRNVICFNPPYSKHVKTNIVLDFLQLIDKHFPPNNKLSKLFNRHTARKLQLQRKHKILHH